MYINESPQFFHASFHVSAKDEESASKKGHDALKKSVAKYERFRVEFIGREYEVLSNREFKFLDGRYKENAVRKVSVFPNSMTIWIEYDRGDKIDHDGFGVWCRPQDFKESVDELFSNINAKEIKG